MAFDQVTLPLPLTPTPTLTPTLTPTPTPTPTLSPTPTRCWESMNIGIVYFPPGARPGALRLMCEATAHLSENNNLRRVDQGPLNFRWKHGTGKWRWKRQLES